MASDSDKFKVVLTENDKLILNSYVTFSECLSNYLGDMYEIVVHSFGYGEDAALKTINCHLSGRSSEINIPVGAHSTIEQLQLCIEHGDKPFTSNFLICSNGNKFKSTSIGITGDNDKLIGMFCINCCLDVPFSEVIKNFTLPVYLKDGPIAFQESYDRRSASSLSQTIISVRDSVLQDESIPSKYKRKEMIRKLNDVGVFNIKNAIQICADILDISIATIYLHLKNIEE